MKTVYVNEILLADREVVRGFIVVDKTISENFTLLFSKQIQQNIIKLINTEPTKKEGFYFFTKFCQFVICFQYDAKKVLIGNRVHTIGISIETMYFGTSDNVNDAFDYMLKLRKTGWGENDRRTILDLAYEIKYANRNPDFEIAELKIKDRYDDSSSFA